MSTTAPKHTNRLIDATSPYLLQHAHNPVDWYPWGEEALARARTQSRPILLSIGYSACHWCHVMAHESFENDDIAALMNEHFVNIKVDREERPDLDDIYMAATQALNQGQGGWPMTVFLTPDQQPFYAGTYFPPEDRWGRPGFGTLLRRIAELWERERDSLTEQAGRLVEFLHDHSRAAPGPSVGEAELSAAAEELAGAFDARWGGFGPAPKFPPSAALMLLLRSHRRSGDERQAEMVRRTLEAMARGGMYDQIGGGFCRYSVDERWLVPHFEKMLYDNALLARVYLEGYQALGDGFFRRIATETFDYVLREMTAPEGGFYSATDADSEGEEGRFFVWTPREVREVLGEEKARRWCASYDISDGGNWEGKSIPNTPRALGDVAEELELSADQLAAELAESRARLYEARQGRVPPGLDDKLLTAWNGLMIGALAEGHRVLREPRYLAAATRAADFVLQRLRSPEGRLLRTFRTDRAHLDAYLEDYAYFAEGLVDLYEAGADERYLHEAETLVGRLLEDFVAPEGGFFSTAAGHEKLIVRHREGHDGATPNANSVAASVLARLSCHLGREDLREHSLRSLRAYAKAMTRQPRGFARALLVVDFLLEGPVELALVGDPGSAEYECLAAELGSRFLPNRVVAHHDPPAEASELPLLDGKSGTAGKATLYVCRDFSCRAPVTSASEVAAALEGQAEAAGERPRSLSAGPLAGCSSGAATGAYASRMREEGLAEGYTLLGSTGLTCSRVGFGGYRVDDENREQREALIRALRSGCNLVDTSTNYTDGGSERLVGEVLAEVVGSGELRREEVVLVSKIGYVQGQNLALAEQRERSVRPFPEMVKYGEGVWHCIHPDFLRDQLERSLGRLRVDCLDVCLLHNPEYFLADAARRGEGSLEERREAFYERLRASFASLEELVSDGRIQYYGVSSNSAGLPAEDPEATSLTRMLELARETAGDEHHCRVLQLPLNLLEPGGALEANNGPELEHTALEWAQSRGVGVLVNRPLNAVRGPGLVRLADFEVPEPEAELTVQLEKVAGLEEEFGRSLAHRVRLPAGQPPAKELFRWARDLESLLPQLGGMPHWEQVERSLILPRLLPLLQSLDRGLDGAAARDFRAWRERYLPELNTLLAVLRARAARSSRQEVEPLRAALDAALPPARLDQSLSRKALWVLTSLAGVSSVLVGMRREAYVEDALGVLSWPSLDDPRAILRQTRPESREG